MECPHCRSHLLAKEPRGTVATDCKCLNCGLVWVEDGFDALVRSDSRRLFWVMASMVGAALLAGALALLV